MINRDVRIGMGHVDVDVIISAMILAILHLNTVFFFEVGNDFIQHHDFASNKFSLFYFKQRLPSTVTVNALTMSQEYFDIEDAIGKVVELVNDNGGWTVIGWYKRGVITDKSLLEVPPSNVVSSEVTAGQINYHIIQLLPSKKSFMDEGSNLNLQLNEKKYDTSRMYQAH